MPALSSRVFRPGAGRAAGVFCRLALVTVLTLAGNATLAAEDSVAPATALAPAAPWGDPLPLVRKGSWAAWEYGPEGNRGWTLIGDRFTASADSAPLLSGWSFADFELTFDLTFGPDARLEVQLPRVPSGDGLTVAFSESPECGRISTASGKETLFAGAPLAAASDGRHRVAITRNGANLSVAIDGKRLGSASINPVRRFGFGLRVVAGDVGVENPAVREPLGEPLVTRDDLADWWTPGNKKSWKVENGELVCLNQNGNYIRAGREFGNFVISFDYLIKKGGNSGIGIRTPHNGWPSGEGMELQITDEKPTTPITRHSPMSIYGNLEPLGRNEKSEEWNRVVIKADGWMISAWMNGVLVQHANTKSLPELSHRFLKGWIGFQDHNDWVRYRNVNIITARDGEGLEAWYVPKPAQPSQDVLDRLMTPERIASPQLLATTTKSFNIKAGKNRQEIAVLEGPGALVGWSVQGPGGLPTAGKISFTFDGEAQPRLDCAPGEVAKRFAPLGDDRSPIFTYAPFATSLRIDARELKEDAVVLLDTVSFTSPVESWRPADAAAARGLLPALTYRREQAGWGKIRDFDPDLRIASPVVSLAPGERQDLLVRDGAGIVQWLQLAAPLDVLANDDLWLEIAIDGESAPAVAAPVRFYFPGLEEGKRFENFLLTTFSSGTVNRLAVPYSSKLVVSLKNTGEKKLSGLGLRASIAERAAEETQPLWRLRGSFASGGSFTDSIDQAGRLAMLVATAPDAGLQNTRLALEPAGADLPFSSLLAAPKAKEDFAGTASGRRRGLAWRMFLLAPYAFERAALSTIDDRAKPGDAAAVYERLFLYYASPAR